MILCEAGFVMDKCDCAGFVMDQCDCAELPNDPV
jgi:hypothetical protein